MVGHAAVLPCMAAAGTLATMVVGHLLQFRRDRLGLLTRAAREQGDMVRLRLGPYRPLLVCHPDLVRDVLVTHQRAYRKGPVLQRARVVLGEGLLTSEGDEHRRQRLLLNRAFHPGRMARYAEVMVAEAERTAGRWRAGRPLDVHAEMVRATLTVAGRTLFATDVAADVTAIEAALADVLSAYGLVLLPAAWRLERVPVGPFRRLSRGREALDGIVRRMVSARRADGRDSGDLLSFLALGDPRSGPAMTDEQIRDHIVTMLLAGHETTANTLTFAWHLLACDPEMERRLHTEVDTVLAGRSATPADCARLPFTSGVIAEALRLYPPSWAMARQARAPHDLGGHAIAPGEVVVVSQWVVHRDPRWWPDPLRADPDRWSADTDAGDRPRHAYFPFGAGARQCIGESFARTEAVLALATLARRWRLRPVPGRPLRLAPLLTLRPRDGLWMRPEAR
jgi:cytochrome P450